LSYLRTINPGVLTGENSAFGDTRGGVTMTGIERETQRVREAERCRDRKNRRERERARERRRDREREREKEFGVWRHAVGRDHDW